MNINDDNTPAPENTLAMIVVIKSFTAGDVTGFVSIVKLAVKTMKHFNISRHNGIPSILQTFEMIFPKVYVEEVIIREINKRIQENKLTFGEFLIWIGLCFFMRTTHFGN